MQQQKKGGGWRKPILVQKHWQKQNHQQGSWRPGNPQKMIWVGNVAERTTLQELKAHAEQVCPARWAEVFSDRGKGTGAVGFASASDVGPAAAALNGTWLNGSRIQVDFWDKHDGGQPNRDWKLAQKQSQKQNYQKRHDESWTPGDPKRMIWVGNLAEGTTLKDLLAHAEQAGKPKWAEVFSDKGKGAGAVTGAVGFTSQSEVAAAVAALNGTLLNGRPLQVDLWAKKWD